MLFLFQLGLACETTVHYQVFLKCCNMAFVEKDEILIYKQVK